ncbi:MAG: hypothetical protein NTY80_00660 [candidate division SR1 bacterium]|nr:hypothetical protein [candidate division SR1 bacterium]
MEVDITKLTGPEKIEFCKNEIKETIDQARASIQEEFSRTANNRTACCASVGDVIDTYRSIARKYIDKEEHDRVNKKIEEFKKELRGLRKIYTTKEIQPNDQEKESLFKHLEGIKKIIFGE